MKPARIFHCHSIKYKYLFATLVMFLLSFLGILFVWYVNLTNEAKRETTENVNSVMQVSNNTFESYLKDIDGITALLTTHSSNYLTSSIIEVVSPNNGMTDAELIQCRKEANDFLISLCSFKKYLNGLTVSDLHGNSMTYGITASHDQLKAQPFYGEITKQSKNGPVFISPHNISMKENTANERVMSISRPIMKGHEEIGFILADIKCSLLDSIYNAKGLDGMSITITDDAAKRFIYKSSSTPEFFNEKALARLEKNLTEKSGSFYSTVGNTDELVVYQKSSLTGWITIGIIPESIVMNNFNQTRNKVIAISGFFLLAASFVIYWLSSVLTKNLLKLNRALQTVDKENLDIHVQINSRDEIAQIYHQFNLMIGRIKHLITENKEAEQKKRIAEIQALQSQITPHFLYNTLNTIKFLAILQGVNNIQTVAENLSTILHVSMDSRQFISIREEIESTKCYIEIQKYRYCNKFSSEVFSDPSLLDCKIPKMILQPIVENALTHGIAPLKREGILTVKFLRSGNDTLICVRDNGVGMKQEQIQQILSKDGEENHIGVYNVNSRIKMYFGENYGLSIRSERGLYTSVDIRLPS
jgi:two-component system sensor histidine kinase YesM